MNIYIPLLPVLAYLVIGVALYVPLAVWQNRFIYSDRGTFENMSWLWLIRAVGICSFMWPVVLIHNLMTEIQYRKKGYL